MDVILCELNLLLFVAYASINSVVVIRQKREIKLLKEAAEKGKES